MNSHYYEELNIVASIKEDCKEMNRFTQQAITNKYGREVCCPMKTADEIIKHTKMEDPP